jgi:hypothetical protein
MRGVGIGLGEEFAQFCISGVILGGNLLAAGANCLFGGLVSRSECAEECAWRGVRFASRNEENRPKSSVCEREIVYRLLFYREDTFYTKIHERA